MANAEADALRTRIAQLSTMLANHNGVAAETVHGWEAELRAAKVRLMEITMSNQG